MPWFKQDAKVPDRIKDMSPEQLAKAVEDKEALEASLQTLRDSETAKQGSITALENQIQHLNQKIQQMANPPAPDPAPDPDENNILVNTQGVLAKAVAPAAAVAFHAGAMAAQTSFENQLYRDPRESRIYGKFKGDVEKIMNQEPPERRILPQTWFNAFTYVKGMKEKEISEAVSRDPNSFFSEQVSGGHREEPEPEAALSPEEEHARVKMSRASGIEITPENWINQRKRINADTKAGSLAGLRKKLANA